MCVSNIDSVKATSRCPLVSVPRTASGPTFASNHQRCTIKRSATLSKTSTRGNSRWARSNSFCSHGHFKPTEKKATWRTATRTPRRSLPGDPPFSSTSTPTPSSHSQSRTVSLVFLTCPRGGTATPTPSAHDESRSAPLVCFTCPRGGTATPTPPAHDQTPPASLVYLTCPKRWHDRGDRRLTKHHPLCWGSGCPFSPPTSPPPSPPPGAPSGIGIGAR